MEEAIEIMDSPGKMKPIVGPMWIVQLWLSTILANHIITCFKLKIEGARLTYITPSREFCTYECYTKYIKAFLNFDSFDKNFGPALIKNTLIYYIKDLIDYIVLERFPVFEKNTLIN